MNPASSAAAARFRLQRVRRLEEVTHAELWAKRDEKWVIVGVMQGTDAEWTDLASLFDAMGVEVTVEAGAWR